MRNGVSLYRIYIRQPTIPSPPKKNLTTTTTTISASVTPVPSTPVTAIPSTAIPIFKITPDLNYVSDDSPPSSQSNPHRLRVPSILTDQSGSSEETGFDTDTTDELSIPAINDPMSTSSLSLGGTSNELNTEVIDL